MDITYIQKYWVGKNNGMCPIYTSNPPPPKKSSILASNVPSSHARIQKFFQGLIVCPGGGGCGCLRPILRNFNMGIWKIWIVQGGPPLDRACY